MVCESTLMNTRALLFSVSIKVHLWSQEVISNVQKVSIALSKLSPILQITRGQLTFSFPVLPPHPPPPISQDFGWHLT